MSISVYKERLERKTKATSGKRTLLSRAKQKSETIKKARMETESLLAVAHLKEEREEAIQIVNKYLDLFESIRHILDKGILI